MVVNASSTETTALLQKMKDHIGAVVQGKDAEIERVLTTLLAGGHLLLEDVPGVGKTTLAHAVAVTIGCSFRRIQFTADMLPSDLIGISLYNQQDQSFEFRPGPLFSQVVLADEINRTSPRTQSALLEAMNEGQITVDRETHPLSRPFLVIATQNPVESYGTYPLPESQLDRFLMRMRLGYPPANIEKEVLRTRKQTAPVEKMTPLIDAETLLSLQEKVDGVHFDEALQDYLYDIIHETRVSNLIAIGVSTRGSLLFHRAVRAYALVQGRNHVIPDDIKTLALPCLAHRITLRQRLSNDTWDPRKLSDTEQVLQDILDRLSIPL
ncbi:MAG: MoxR family ATPase [Myxococcales bacterium]|nr:MoxR family ATPase [Myxococcales bacterium]